MEEDEITMFTLDLPMYMHPFDITGLRTGYYELNSRLSGWQSDEYVIVGYTNPEDANEFISQNANAANRFGHKIGIISLRVGAKYAIISSDKSVILRDCNTIFDIRKGISRLVRENDVCALFVDDLLCISCHRGELYTYNTVHEADYDDLSGIMNELRIPVIALLQLPKNNDAIKITDLTELGAIDENANIVIALTRDKKGKITPDVIKIDRI